MRSYTGPKARTESRDKPGRELLWCRELERFPGNPARETSRRFPLPYTVSWVFFFSTKKAAQPSCCVEVQNAKVNKKYGSETLAALIKVRGGIGATPGQHTALCKFGGRYSSAHQASPEGTVADYKYPTLVSLGVTAQCHSFHALLLQRPAGIGSTELVGSVPREAVTVSGRGGSRNRLVGRPEVRCSVGCLLAAQTTIPGQIRPPTQAAHGPRDHDVRPLFPRGEHKRNRRSVRGRSVARPSRPGCCRLSTVHHASRPTPSYRRPLGGPFGAQPSLPVRSLVDQRAARCIRPQGDHPWLTRCYKYFASARTSVGCHGSSMHRTGHSRWARVRGTETVWCGGFIAGIGAAKSCCAQATRGPALWDGGGGQEVNGRCWSACASKHSGIMMCGWERQSLQSLPKLAVLVPNRAVG
jgi:hypothetical protein